MQSIIVFIDIHCKLIIILSVHMTNLQSNVEGERCDKCKPGFFDLREENPDGCSRCFCFDRSGRCVSSDLGLIKVHFSSFEKSFKIFN